MSDKDTARLISKRQDNSLSKALASEYHDNKFSDVRLICSDGIVVNSHRVVLASLSDFLKAILNEEDDDIVLSLPDLSSDVLIEFLKRVYEGGDDEVIIGEDLAYLGLVTPDKVKVEEEEVSEDLVESVEVRVMRKQSGKKGLVWKYFAVIDEDNVRCLECEVGVRTEGGATIGMTRHLKHVHGEIFAKLGREKEDYVMDDDDLDLSDDEAVIGKVDEEEEESASTKDSGVSKSSKDGNRCKICGKVVVGGRRQGDSFMVRHSIECKKMSLKDDVARHNAKLLGQKSGIKKRIRRRDGSDKKSLAGEEDKEEDRTCLDCKKVFSCRPAMLYHCRVVHSGVRPFRCDDCGVTFARLDSYRGHTHSKVRSFLCSVCGKTFARKNIRDVHERAHYGDRRYQCSFCEKRFMTNQQKTNHERVHTGERPFQCQDCGRQFAQQHQLKTHIRIHTGEKPYVCPGCPMVFRHLSSRNSHKCEGKMMQTTTTSTVGESDDVAVLEEAVAVTVENIF